MNLLPTFRFSYRTLVPTALLAAVTVVPSTLSAQILPTPDRSDPRLASVRYSPTGMIRLEVPVGREVTLILPPGENLSSVDVAAPGNWSVDARGGGQLLVVRPLRPVPDTTMAVQTTARIYSFVLAATPNGNPPMLVRISAPAATRADGSSPALRARRPRAVAEGRAAWKLLGRSELYPSSLRDDGSKTYLEWPADQPMPAVFALDRLGREEMVNGYMRGTIFTIDRVYPALIFRIDRATAKAVRQARGGAD